MQSSRVAECQQTAERRTTCSIACRGYGDSRTKCIHRMSRNASRKENKMQSSRVAGEKEEQDGVIACRGMHGGSKTRCSHRVSRERKGRTRRSPRVSRKRQNAVIASRGKDKLQSSRVAGCQQTAEQDAVIASRGMQETAEQDAVIACRGMPADSRTECSHRESRDARDRRTTETEGAVTCWSSVGFGLWRFGSPWPSCIGESG
jgi:hypothetical protein